MSILLDALRKSEEQRRLGETPSIHNGPDRQPAGGDSTQQWIPLGLIALSAIAMAWIGWQQYQRPLTAVDTDVAASMGTQRPPPAEADQAETPAVPGSAPRTPIETFAQTGETEQSQPDPAPPESPQTAVRTARVSDSVKAFEGGTEPAGDPRQPDRPEAAATARQPAASEPITFWELPQGVRDSMPELRITVLVYAEQAEDRFLLMSGQRLVEKDEYEGGVVLEEIRRDGAVFVYRNYRFLVKG